MVSLDWKWLFIYPGEQIASIGQLVVPVGAPVHFRLTSSSVMNSLFVPQLGSQIYTMAGMTTQLNLQADDLGSYPGISAQFSGEGFSDMRFDVKAVSTEDYRSWVQSVRAHGGLLDSARYAELMRPSINDSPTTFGTVRPRLFEAIVSGRGSYSSSAGAR